MNKIIIYVEGPSDRLAMEELLEGLLRQLQAQGIAVDFVAMNGKSKLMNKTPLKAVNILNHDPEAVVIALPDLYPPNVGFSHHTVEELNQVLKKEFEHCLQLKRKQDKQLNDRFRIFCFKYDLEALVLAAEAQLAERLGVEEVLCTWKKPVEDQNHNKPPKRIVEEIFKTHGEHYKDTIDAPLILGAAAYPEIAEMCPQCFKPFVDYLESFLNRKV